jgi:A-macroglobulin TED domain/Alpha-2-macroglobulin family/MG2 domain/Macroglobulin domain MG3/Alpha-2-macroglobulin bait region domain/A-macroglobulin receptor binding domain
MRERRFGAASAVLCVLVCLLTVADTGDGAPAPSATVKKKLPARAAVDAYILGPTAMVAGARASYRVAVHWASGPGRSGPLPGAEVKVGLAGPRHKRVALARVRTDANGDARLRFVVPKWKPGSGYALRVDVRSSLGRTSRKQPVSLHAGGRFLLTTDKKLYQPSQTIHIRALGLRGIDLLPVAGGGVQLQVKDPKDNIVFERTLKTSRFGVASADFKLAAEINLGHYTVVARGVGASVVGVASRRVEVKRYVLPKFKVTVETDRSYYRPGETVQGTVRARYFFGKPVAGAQVVLGGRSVLNGGLIVHALPILRTDSQGRATFKLHLSRHADGVASRGVGEVRLKATVKDSAEHVQRGDVSVPLTAHPLTLSVVPENHALVPGVRNRVHVLAGYPDGSPARGVQVKLQLSTKRVLKGRTDKLGVATFTIVPRRDGPRCGAGGMALPVTARDRLGQRGGTAACAPLAQIGAALVRPDRSMVAPGQVVELTLLAAAQRRFKDRRIYVDVVKSGQILATYSRRLRGASARVTFQPDPTLFGLLELRAYRLTRGGERVGTSRLVFVEHPGRLKIKITPDRKTYRPGGRARVAFEVTDSRSGEGVEAALGLLAVDEAVIAMGGLPAGRSPKRFFSLAGQLRSGESGPKVRPGGRGLGHWVTAERSPAATRARAADVLLAALRAPEATVWETNPWKERREAWAELAPQMIQSARSFMALHSVGRRTARGWRFHPELVPRMVQAKAIEAKDLHDPWRRVVRPWHLHATDKSFAFAPLARRLAPQKLARIYTALIDDWKKLKLPRERMRKLKRQQWPLILPRDLLARLVRLGKLKPGAIVDPWGKPYRVLRNPKLFINPYGSGLVSRYHIYSAGPDGRFGSKDDLGPRGPRVSVAVFGRDAALGIDAEDALGGLIGGQIGETHGVGGLGLMGTGSGGGGMGEGTIGLGSIGTFGKGGGGMPARVRQNFPETLLWRPEVITDKRGRALVDVDLADSITTWRMLATGSSATGLLGQASATLRVFQDFFVDIDLPVALTQGDRISVPVTIYNYLKTPQRVTLRLRREGWFKPLGALSKSVVLKPSEVTVRYFPIVARAVGRRDLTVHASARDASGAAVSDAVRRTTLVEPDGVEHATAQGGTLMRGAVQHAVEIPGGAIHGTERVQLAIYAGPMSQTITGMEGMLRRPYGCFEQTSSSTYPNVLILDYLRRTKQLKPKVEKMARAYINEGYQRLIGYEVPGGGFSWFGRAPANKILTAYGLMEFYDMARVHKVDPRIIRRTQAWLVGLQRRDGSWGPDRSFINEGATNHFNKDSLRIAAYIAHALRHTGYRGKALDRALGYVRAHASKAKDAYTLATLGNLLAPDRGRTTQRVFKALWKRRKADDKGIYFAGPQSTLTYGGGKSSQIETTALSALAFLSRPRSVKQPAGVPRIIDKLVSSKDSRGSWHSTQATILSLRALLLHQERSRSKPAGEVQVLVDGKLHRRVLLRADQDRAHQLDLTRLAAAGGRHTVALKFTGEGNLQYQLVGRYWLPRRSEAAEPKAGKPGQLAISTSYDRRSVKKGGDLRLDVAIRNRGRKRVEMPLVDLALPPGFALQRGALAGLVRAGRVEKVQRVGTRALLYLTKLKPRQSMHFSLNLTSKYPLRVQARPSVIYEYYKPENRAQSRATTLQVL